MIPRQISAAFGGTARPRGDEYFLGQRVRIAAATATDLKALVRGTENYTILLAAQPGLISATCSCPYFADRGNCKHIWAVTRQADHDGKLHGLVSTAGPGFQFVATPDDDPRHADLAAAPMPRLPRMPASPPPSWRQFLDTARAYAQHSFGAVDATATKWPLGRRIIYIVDFVASEGGLGLVVEVASDARTAEGTWKPPAQLRVSREAWQAAPDARDREIAQMLLGASRNSYFGDHQRPSTFMLDAGAIATMLPILCATGRCRVRRMRGERPMDPVVWEDAEPWQFRVRVIRASDRYEVTGVLQRGADEMPLSEAALVHASGVLFARGMFSRFDHGDAFGFVTALRQRGTIHVPESDFPRFLESVYGLPRRPNIDLPGEAEVAEVRVAPQPGVVIEIDPRALRGSNNQLRLFFIYAGTRVNSGDVATSVYDRSTRTLYHRDLAQESEARATLIRLGAREEWMYGGSGRVLMIPAPRTPRVMSELVQTGWRVEANGVLYRAAVPGRARVRSGVDWFELEAVVRFGDMDVSLSDVLAARRTGAAAVVLSDGSHGLLPLEWLARLGPLAAGGVPSNGALRYARSQTALLDALLLALPDADVDATFERARTELRAFETLTPLDPPASFRGTLREYQRDGLAWLVFLRRFGLGGCLADDMGLGKTVQVLAMLEGRHSEQRETRKPSLVVVPRSLVFNWQREAERFTPDLRVLDYTGTARDVAAIPGADIVLTTYGTLRRDAAKLAAVEFDYAILDEAQAIKTASSASAKAARLLRAEYRLALTGTPIENRLEELWSLFEFLNPGMLGQSASFASLIRLAGESDEPAERDVLARALRPVILRRTKEKVAPELPERVEQTLSVDLEGTQRKFYDELLTGYRESVLDRVDRVGLGKAKMHILEALLRLRQVACHPVLADARRASAPSAKLDALLPALEEVAAEGHKALVFSQFTSFLDLVRRRLTDAEIPFEYLDGKTRDRQTRVDRFQEDPACPVFLISLKAGGHGLNLTAADYVFILDPWWNPAVEAQAIDRAHRIGQTRRVIATRIVARGTIEEKILELQASKRALADAILGQDQGILTGIGRAELEMLLG